MRLYVHSLPSEQLHVSTCIYTHYRAGLLLAEWLVTSRIIEHIFGPNLHNELVKQSQLVLHFLGNEGKITVEHIDIMWAAAMVRIYYSLWFTCNYL